MKSLLMAAAVLLSACVSSQAQEEQPAVIVNPTAQSRAELLQAVSTALQGVKTMLAEDALTNTSILFVERPAVHDAAGRRINGRDLGRPERFQLMMHGDRCVLVHENSGVRHHLVNATCQVVDPGT
jgi:hypothetical protein